MDDTHDDDVSGKCQLREPAAALRPHDALAIVVSTALRFEWNSVGGHDDRPYTPSPVSHTTRDGGGCVRCCLLRIQI